METEQKTRIVRTNGRPCTQYWYQDEWLDVGQIVARTDMSESKVRRYLKSGMTVEEAVNYVAPDTTFKPGKNRITKDAEQTIAVGKRAELAAFVLGVFMDDPERLAKWIKAEIRKNPNKAWVEIAIPAMKLASNTVLDGPKTQRPTVAQQFNFTVPAITPDAKAQTFKIEHVEESE